MAMYENATTVQLLPGTFDRALGILRNCIVPALKAQKGLCSLGLIPHRESHQIVVISLWRSKTDALAAEAACAYRRQLKQLDPLLDQQPAPPVHEPRLHPPSN